MYTHWFWVEIARPGRVTAVRVFTPYVEIVDHILSGGVHVVQMR